MRELLNWPGDLVRRFLTRQYRRKPWPDMRGPHEKPWKEVRDDGLFADEAERQRYELAINAALRGGETIVVVGPDGVTVNDERFDSLDEAVTSEKARRAEPPGE